jgi:23S rRNA maturation mini-RNase III
LSVNNKLWKNESFHTSFEEADSIRFKLLRIWESDPKHEGMQIKIKYMSSKNKFVVKTRLHPDFEEKKENKKRGKNRKRNKKNTDTRMFDASSSV